MSGSQPQPAAHPPGAAAADPSMEDILASIRRILSEDEPAAATPPPAPIPEPAAEPEPAADDVLVLDASMEVATEPPAQPSAEPAYPAPEPPEPAAAEPEPAVLPLPAAEPMPAIPLALPPALMAPETTAAAASSVTGLMRTLATERSTRVYGGGPTIEDLVREELRPLLKQWLDSNLPDLVERLVRAEIERVVRRAVP